MNKSTLKKLNFPAVIDIGNSHIRVCVPDRHADGSLQLLGVGECESAGVEGSMVVDIEKATTAIISAIKRASFSSGCDITHILPAVSGTHIAGMAGDGSAVISDNSVDAADIAKVKEMASTAVHAHGQEKDLLGCLEREYEIDGIGGISQPLEMTGKRLIGHMHLITASRRALENMEKCLNNAGVELSGKGVFAGLAAAKTVLSEDEKKLGVCLVDIGAESTELTIYANGNVYETKVLRIAGDDIHSDIAHVHSASLKDAQRVKTELGVIADDSGRTVVLSDASEGDESEVPVTVVHQTIVARVEEILKDIMDTVRHFENTHAPHKLSAGLVFAGNGALLPGLADFARAELGIGARIGHPRYRGDKNELVKQPCFAVSVGLAMMALERPLNVSESWLTKIKNFFDMN